MASSILFSHSSQEDGSDFHFSVEESIFELFHTLTEGNTRNESLSVFGLFIEFFQLIFFILSSGLSGDFRENVLDAFSLSSIPFATWGKATFYAGFVLCSITILFISVSSFIVARSVQQGGTHSVAIIMLLRTISALLSTTLYIPMVRLFLLPMSCAADSSEIHDIYESSQALCWEWPYLFLPLFSLLVLVIFIPFALVMSLIFFDSDPQSTHPFARPSSTFEFKYTILKTLWTFVYVLRPGHSDGGTSTLFSFVLLLSTLWLAYESTVCPQFYKHGWNIVRSSLLTSAACLSISAFTSNLLESSDINSYHLSVFTSSAFLGFLLGLFLHQLCCYLRRKRMDRFLKGVTDINSDLSKRFFFSLNESSSLMDSTRSFSELRQIPVGALGTDPALKAMPCFHSDTEVEVCTRFLIQGQTPFRVRAGEMIYRAGIKRYPKSPYVSMCFANFLVVYMHDMQGANLQIQHTLKLQPSFSIRFSLFCIRKRWEKEREALNLGSHTVMNVIDHVEFRRNLKIAQEHHTAALKASEAFWGTLIEKHVYLGKLMEASKNIERNQKKAEKAYGRLIRRFPKSKELLRQYGHFQLHVKNNPSLAQSLFDQADLLEEEAGKEIAQVMSNGALDGNGSEFAHGHTHTQHQKHTHTHGHGHTHTHSHPPPMLESQSPPEELNPIAEARFDQHPDLSERGDDAGGEGPPVALRHTVAATCSCDSLAPPTGLSKSSSAHGSVCNSTSSLLAHSPSFAGSAGDPSTAKTAPSPADSAPTTPQHLAVGPSAVKVRRRALSTNSATWEAGDEEPRSLALSRGVARPNLLKKPFPRTDAFAMDAGHSEAGSGHCPRAKRMSTLRPGHSEAGDVQSIATTSSSHSTRMMSEIELFRRIKSRPIKTLALNFRLLLLFSLLVLFLGVFGNAVLFLQVKSHTDSLSNAITIRNHAIQLVLHWRRIYNDLHSEHLAADLAQSQTGLEEMLERFNLLHYAMYQDVVNANFLLASSSSFQDIRDFFLTPFSDAPNVTAAEFDPTKGQLAYFDSSESVYKPVGLFDLTNKMSLYGHSLLGWGYGAALAPAAARMLAAQVGNAGFCVDGYNHLVDLYQHLVEQQLDIQRYTNCTFYSLQVLGVFVNAFVLYRSFHKLARSRDEFLSIFFHVPRKVIGDIHRQTADVARQFVRGVGGPDTDSDDDAGEEAHLPEWSSPHVQVHSYTENSDRSRYFKCFVFLLSIVLLCGGLLTSEILFLGSLSRKNEIFLEVSYLQVDTIALNTYCAEVIYNDGLLGSLDMLSDAVNTSLSAISSTLVSIFDRVVGDSGPQQTLWFSSPCVCADGCPEEPYHYAALGNMHFDGLDHMLAHYTAEAATLVSDAYAAGSSVMGFVANTTSEHYRFIDTASQGCLLEGLRTSATYCRDDLFDTLDISLLTHGILFFFTCVLLVVLFVFILNPIINLLNEEHSRSSAMLLVFPPEVIKTLDIIGQYLKSSHRSKSLRKLPIPAPPLPSEKRTSQVHPLSPPHTPTPVAPSPSRQSNFSRQSNPSHPHQPTSVELSECSVSN